MSIAAIAVMGILFLSETAAFASSRIATSIAVDENTSPQIRLNFNITMLDVNCDYVNIDVWDALGTNRQNVTKNVDKWHLDEDGIRRVYGGRNRESRELEHETHEKTLEEMHQEEGVHAIELTSENFDEFMEENPMAFVDMFAPWYVFAADESAQSIRTCLLMSYILQVCLVPALGSDVGEVRTGS